MAQRCYDKQLEFLIEIHRLVHTQGSLDKRSKVHGVAHWARGRGNVVFALGLALFALRLGHYNRYIVGSATDIEGYEVCRQIIKEIKVFWGVWYLAMLAQFRARLSLGLRGAATIWVRHLRNNVHLIFEDIMTARVSGVGLHAIHWILKAVVDAEVLLGPTDNEASGLPDGAIQLILEHLLCNRFMLPYVCQAVTDLKYAAAITAYRRNIQDGELKAAQCALYDFLNESESVGNTSLKVILQKIDILYQAGESDRAEVSMSLHVSDNDMFTIIPPYHESSQGLVEAMSRSVRRCRLKSLEAIFLSCIKLRFWQRAVQLMLAIEEVSPGYFTSVTAYTELWPWQRCLYAGLVHESQGDFQEAYLYFLQGRVFLLEIAGKMTDDDFRLILAMNDATRLLGSAARRALLWKQDLPGCTTLGPTSNPAIDSSVFRIFTTTTHYTDMNDHFIESLVSLEAARPQYIWSDESGDVTPEQAEAQYKVELWKELMQKSHRSREEEVEFQTLHPLRERHLAVFHQTAHLRKKTAELSLESVGSFFRSVPEDATVLYIFTTEDGCILMALDELKVRMAAFQPSATIAMLEKTVIMFVDAIKENNALATDFAGRILDNVLVKPLANCIAKRRHVIFVLSGILTRIPVSALRYDGDYLILKRQVSQVPSLRALHSLQSRRSLKLSQHKPIISVIARPGGPKDRWLPMAGIEASLIGRLFKKPAVNAEDVGREDFRRVFRESEFLHICTHGLQDADHPFNSQIILHDKFRVLDLLAVRGDVALVTFSACHSGAGHASDSGDIQGFSHAVLAAGAHAYLGALWKVNDVATMIHMWIFYCNFWIVQDKASFSEAWQTATRILYSLTTEKAIAQLEQFIEILDISEHGGTHLVGLAGRKEKRKLLGVIKSWKEGKDIINFKEPSIWAPFVMVGNASQRIWTEMQWFTRELLNYRQTKHDVSPEEFLAHFKSLKSKTLERKEAIQTGCWEGNDEAPVPKEFTYRPSDSLISTGGFEGRDEAPMPQPFALV
jgi:CHAT domain-containing protein